MVALLFAAFVPAGTASATQGAFGWGNNATGELADATTTNRLTPVAMQGMSGLVSISVGWVHGLGLRSDGRVIAWGHNKSGQLGNGTITDHTTPVSVSGLTNVRAISAGTSFSLAVRNDGAVFAWGNNASGELGDGSAPSDHTTPVAVSSLGVGSGVVALAAGGSHALALKSNGAVYAWGNNASGQLGDGSAPSDHTTPVAVSSLGAGSGVVAIAAGATFSLALKSNGTVVAWGNNQSGELGDGTTIDRATPVLVHGLSGVRRIAAGGASSYALRSSGGIAAWGNNQSGQLGDGSAPNDQMLPVNVSGIANAVDVAAGRAHALALLSNGTVRAWGDNNLGQLGIGSSAQQHLPVAVVALGPADHLVRVSAGGDHSHAFWVSSSPSTTVGSTVPTTTPDGGTTATTISPSDGGTTGTQASTTIGSTPPASAVGGNPGLTG